MGTWLCSRPGDLGCDPSAEWQRNWAWKVTVGPGSGLGGGQGGRKPQGGRGQEGCRERAGQGGSTSRHGSTWESRVWGSGSSKHLGCCPQESTSCRAPCSGRPGQGIGRGLKMIRRTTHPLILAKKGPSGFGNGKPCPGRVQQWPCLEGVLGLHTLGGSLTEEPGNSESRNA